VEGGAEVGAVDDGVARRFRVVQVFAARTVEFHGRSVGHVGLAHWEEGLGVAHYAGAFPEVGLFELFELFRGGERLAGRTRDRVEEDEKGGKATYHLCESPVCDDVACMDEAV
jgi:hypothetical protein